MKPTFLLSILLLELLSATEMQAQSELPKINKENFISRYLLY